MPGQQHQNVEVGLSTNTKPARLLNWAIAGWHWWVIGSITLLLAVFEAYTSLRQGFVFSHAVELGVFLLLLLAVSLLVSLLLREIYDQDRRAKILELRNELRLEFSGCYDWTALVTQLARFPGTVATVEQACLFVPGSISGQFELAAHWGGEGEEASDLCSNENFQQRLGNPPRADLEFGPCEPQSIAGQPPFAVRTFCLPIRYEQKLLGILLFKLVKGVMLTNEQKEIYRNVSDELAIALRLGQERKAFYEMRASETALAERRWISQYLHDHLGQNLGYLHIKMDQLLAQKTQPALEDVLDDLAQMRTAADDSYQIVRGILETLRPATKPTLTNLLQEHARKISQRADFKLDFKTKGMPFLIPAEAQSAIFYAFEETLSNVEKHARANNIAVILDWSQDDILLTISDDGVGFDPQSVDTDHHFGLEILNERMAKVNGSIILDTLENAGTVVTIRVPAPFFGQREEGL